MDRIENLVQKIFAEEVNPMDLSTNDLELVIDHLYELAEQFVGTDKHEMAVAMLEILHPLVDDRLAETDISDFADAVEAAELRGSTYFEFDTYTLH